MVRAACLPIANLSQAVLNAVTDFGKQAFSGKSLAEENRRLLRQVNALSLYNETNIRLQREIDSLRATVKLGATYNRPKVYGDVIGFSDREHRATISVGARSGVEPKMPVVCAEGLVGIVQTVSANDCQILLITSPAVKLSALLSGHNPAPAGLIRGDGSSTNVFTVQNPQAPVTTNDLVITSGFSDRIPKGIPIGKVISYESLVDSGITRIQVFPFAKISDLREVVILK